MPDLQTISNIVTLIIAMLGGAFGIYAYFRNPQVNLERGNSLQELNIKNIFDRLNGFDATLVNLRDNHLHTMDVKIDQTNANVNNLALEVTKLATIINERIPRKES